MPSKVSPQRMHPRSVVLLPALASLLFACAKSTPTPDTMNTRPDDFAILYEWQEGSLPPPYHYEYTVAIQPDGQGQVVIIPDYPSEDVPTWTEAFTVPPTELDRLYQLMVDKALFAQKWRSQEAPPVGGSSESMTVTAHGVQIVIPVYVIPAQADAAAEMFSAVTGLVPQAVWEKLNAQREEYVKEHGE